MRRCFVALVLFFLLTLPVLASQPQYLLCVRGGMICVVDLQTKQCRSTGHSLASLPNAADRALLERGLLLPDRKSLTSAMEDFCS